MCNRFLVELILIYFLFPYIGQSHLSSMEKSGYNGHSDAAGTLPGSNCDITMKKIPGKGTHLHSEDGSDFDQSSQISPTGNVTPTVVPTDGKSESLYVTTDDNDVLKNPFLSLCFSWQFQDCEI